MKKIPTLFVRDPDNMKLVLDRVTPGLEWVLDGQCIAREKLDGTACAILNGWLYKRHTVKILPAGIPMEPHGFIPSAGLDGSKQPGWVPVGDGPEDRWHREAFQKFVSPPNGTYELIGPKVQGNPYVRQNHALVSHEATSRFRVPDLSLAGLEAFMSEELGTASVHSFIEGIVFWGPEGPVAKIKRRDFGLPWPVKAKETQG